MSETTTVQISECTEPAELYRHYQNEFEPQPCYIELDLRDGMMLATYNAEIGNAVPFEVYYGFQRRYAIPILHAEAVNRVMEELTPLAERVLADWEKVWDGENMVARLGEDAEAAEEEIRSKLVFDEGDPDLLVVWSAEDAVYGSDSDITAATTDKELDDLEAQILREFKDSAEEGQVIHLDGVGAYLRQIRDQLADEDPLTDAELRAAREYLGLTGDHLAKVLGVNPRTLRSWEQGRDPIPGRIRPEIAELLADTKQTVEAMVEEEEDVLFTYRDDEEYQAANPADRWSAAWHRRVCARTAERTGARVEYAEED